MLAFLCITFNLHFTNAVPSSLREGGVLSGVETLVRLLNSPVMFRVIFVSSEVFHHSFTLGFPNTIRMRSTLHLS